MHVLGSCEASAQYSPINIFVNLFHSKNSNLPDCFSDLIHTEYRKLHENNGHSPFVSPSIMRSSVGQCRNIRFRQLSASHVIITSDFAQISIAQPIKIMILLSCVADDTYRSLSSNMGVAKCNSDCSSVTVCPFDQSIGDSQKRGRGYVGDGLIDSCILLKNNFKNS